MAADIAQSSPYRSVQCNADLEAHALYRKLAGAVGSDGGQNEEGQGQWTATVV